ncbi:MAG: hypothetical protein SNG27_09815 [Rikenellaceae bacterium]
MDKILYTFDKTKRIITQSPEVIKCVFTDSELEVDLGGIKTRIDIIMNTLNCAKDIIKRDKCSLSTYTLLFDKLKEYREDIAKVYSIDIHHEPKEEEIRIAYNRRKSYYEDRAEEDDLIGFLRYESGEDAYCLEDDDIIYNYQDDLITDARREVVKNNPYYEQYKRLESYFNTLTISYNNDEVEREVANIIHSYKPTKEQRLETYFRCDNYEALKSILRRDLQGRGGVAVAKVLVALSNAGCEVIDNKFEPLFENILTTVYGVTGKRYSVSKNFGNLNDATEKNNKKTANEIACLTEKYKSELK